jgi:hypothetical protein
MFAYSSDFCVRFGPSEEELSLAKSPAYRIFTGYPNRETALGQGIDKQSARLGIAVSTPGGKDRDVLLSVLALPSDGY